LTHGFCASGERGGERCSNKRGEGRKNKWIPGQTGIMLEEVESQTIGGIYAIEADFSN
jgi:hypothetical protein